MDKRRFEELFNDVARWTHQARRLRLAGDELTASTSARFIAAMSDEKGRATQSASFRNAIESFRALSDARALLYGLAIENACKARLIRSKIITVQNGAAKGLRTDHNVLEMVRQSGCSPSPEQSEFLGLLAYQIRVLAKYPIAKDLSGQNQFTGRAVGARPEESATVQNIIVAVLQDSDLVGMFLNGYSDRV